MGHIKYEEGWITECLFIWDTLVRCPRIRHSELLMSGIHKASRRNHSDQSELLRCRNNCHFPRYQSPQFG
jgi:hypothetical protein